MGHEVIKVLVIDDGVVGESRVFVKHAVRLLKLGVDPGKLVDGSGNPETGDMRRQELVVERVS